MQLTPFQRFVSGLEAAQMDFNSTMDELRAFAEIMARKANTLDLDEDGTFYITAAGPLEEIINTLKTQLKKLERIKEQKENDTKGK